MAFRSSHTTPSKNNDVCCVRHIGFPFLKTLTCDLLPAGGAFSLAVMISDLRLALWWQSVPPKCRDSRTIAPRNELLDPVAIRYVEGVKASLRCVPLTQLQPENRRA